MKLLVLLLLTVTAGSAAAQEVVDTTAWPPAGFGTLGQEQVAVRLSTPTIELRVLPLDERVIRLLAPDTYASFHRLLEKHRPQIDSIAFRRGIGVPAVLLVTFFGLEERARFEPELLSVSAQNRLFRPLEILPLSPQWLRRQLDQRQTASGIYIFPGDIRILDPFDVSYDDVVSRDWGDRLRRLDRERAGVLSRAGRRPPH